MRKIKFRGKDINTKEWVYGSLFNGIWLNDTKPYSVIFTENEYLKDEQSSNEIVLKVGIDKAHIVTSDSVGQFTGLYDKKGTEIYEGDIYRYKEPDSINEVSYCIGGGFAGFDLSPTSHDENKLLDVEILGNIHDNANLLYSD